MDLVNIDCRTG